MKRSITKALSALLAVIIMATCSLPVTAFAATQGEMISKVLEIAQGEVGYKGNNKHTKY